MTTSVLVLRHLAFEDLGILESVLIEQGDQVRYLDIGVDPIDAEAIVAADLLVVLGGPIGVGDIELFPYLAQEIAAIDARLKVRRRTLGICLGAQLIAAARGERVYPSPGGVEIGFGPLDLTAAGAAGPLGEVAGTPVLHWHGDTFDLPGDAELLASTPACANQAFAIDDHVLALQFHVVHGRADTVLAAHLVDGVNPLGEEQYPFRQGGFARIDVGADTDIPYFAQVFFHHAFLGCRLQVACLGRERKK